MRFFTSHRERRLWISTIVVMIAIYSTMGPVGGLVTELRTRNLLRLTMALILILVLGILAWRWLRSRPDWDEVGVVLGITAVYLIAWVRIPIPEERTHLIEYGLVALLLHQILLERQRNGRLVPLPAVTAILLTALLGLLDELVQAMLPYRVYDIRDVGFNALAGLMAIGASLAISNLPRHLRR